MSLGAKIRRAMGPLERPVANLFRSLFVNIEDLVTAIQHNHPNDKQVYRILEIGGGEGAITELLLHKFKDAHITSIDIAPTIGRLFTGDRSRVEFMQITAEEFAATQPEKFDLIIICDVLHHVPWNLHKSILEAGCALLKEDGVFIIKEWENRANPINVIAYLIERYITGDRVKYARLEELETLISSVFIKQSIFHTQRIRPWKNNVLFMIKAS